MNYKTRMAAAAVISLAVFWISEHGTHGSFPGDADVTLRAARIMGQAVHAIAAERERSGNSFEPSSDPNRTGLVGPQDSPLVTTVGELEAKRTTTNPNMAGLIVLLLRQAGVKAGDSVAIGSSGSFPALLVASLAAAKAMDVQPVGHPVARSLFLWRHGSPFRSARHLQPTPARTDMHRSSCRRFFRRRQGRWARF